MRRARPAALSLAAAIAAAALLAAAPAHAETVPDVICGGAPGAPIALPEQGRAAESFISGLTGTVTSVRLTVSKVAPGNPGDRYDVGVTPFYGDAPTPNLTPFQAGIDVGRIPPGAVDVSVEVPLAVGIYAAPSVTRGARFGVVVSRPAGTADSLRFATAAGNPSCRGTLFTSASQTAPFIPVAGDDLAFQVFTDPGPVIRIARHPKRRTRKRLARFSVTAREPGVEFWCSRDQGPFRVCGPRFSFRRLKPGRHRVTVYGLAASGLKGASARFTWRVRP